MPLTLQYVRRSEDGRQFEARLFDFANDFAITRPTLAQLLRMVAWLTVEIEQPGRMLSDLEDQESRIRVLFADAADAENQSLPQLADLTIDLMCAIRDSELTQTGTTAVEEYAPIAAGA
jgi:hypothetical protein